MRQVREGPLQRAFSHLGRRQLVDHYEQVIEEQQDEILELRRQLAERERPKPHCIPAIR